DSLPASTSLRCCSLFLILKRSSSSRGPSHSMPLGCLDTFRPPSSLAFYSPAWPTSGNRELSNGSNRQPFRQERPYFISRLGLQLGPSIELLVAAVRPGVLRD